MCVGGRKISKCFALSTGFEMIAGIVFRALGTGLPNPVSSLHISLHCARVQNEILLVARASLTQSLDLRNCTVDDDLQKR